MWKRVLGLSLLVACGSAGNTGEGPTETVREGPSAPVRFEVPMEPSLAEKVDAALKDLPEAPFFCKSTSHRVRRLPNGDIEVSTALPGGKWAAQSYSEQDIPYKIAFCMIRARGQSVGHESKSNEDLLAALAKRGASVVVAVGDAEFKVSAASSTTLFLEQVGSGRAMMRDTSSLDTAFLEALFEKLRGDESAPGGGDPMLPPQESHGFKETKTVVKQSIESAAGRRVESGGTGGSSFVTLLASDAASSSDEKVLAKLVPLSLGAGATEPDEVAVRELTADDLVDVASQIGERDATLPASTDPQPPLDALMNNPATPDASNPPDASSASDGVKDEDPPGADGGRARDPETGVFHECIVLSYPHIELPLDSPVGRSAWFLRTHLSRRTHVKVIDLALALQTRRDWAHAGSVDRKVSHLETVSALVETLKRPGPMCDALHTHQGRVAALKWWARETLRRSAGVMFEEYEPKSRKVAALVERHRAEDAREFLRRTGRSTVDPADREDRSDVRHVIGGLGRTAVMQACRSHDAALVRQLLGGKLHQDTVQAGLRDYNGDTALHLCARFGDADMSAAVLEHTPVRALVEVNSAFENPLMHACRHGAPETALAIVRALENALRTDANKELVTLALTQRSLRDSNALHACIVFSTDAVVGAVAGLYRTADVSPVGEPTHSNAPVAIEDPLVSACAHGSEGSVGVVHQLLKDEIGQSRVPYMVNAAIACALYNTGAAFQSLIRGWKPTPKLSSAEALAGKLKVPPAVLSCLRDPSLPTFRFPEFHQPLIRADFGGPQKFSLVDSYSRAAVFAGDNALAACARAGRHELFLQMAMRGVKASVPTPPASGAGAGDPVPGPEPITGESVFEARVQGPDGTTTRMMLFQLVAEAEWGAQAPVAGRPGQSAPASPSVQAIRVMLEILGQKRLSRGHIMVWLSSAIRRGDADLRAFVQSLKPGAESEGTLRDLIDEPTPSNHPVLAAAYGDCRPALIVEMLKLTRALVASDAGAAAADDASAAAPTPDPWKDLMERLVEPEGQAAVIRACMSRGVADDEKEAATALLANIMGASYTGEVLESIKKQFKKSTYQPFASDRCDGKEAVDGAPAFCERPCGGGQVAKYGDSTLTPDAASVCYAPESGPHLCACTEAPRDKPEEADGDDGEGEGDGADDEEGAPAVALFTATLKFFESIRSLRIVGHLAFPPPIPAPSDPDVVLSQAQVSALTYARAALHVRRLDAAQRYGKLKKGGVPTDELTKLPSPSVALVQLKALYSAGVAPDRRVRASSRAGAAGQADAGGGMDDSSWFGDGDLSVLMASGNMATFAMSSAEHVWDPRATGVLTRLHTLLDMYPVHPDAEALPGVDIPPTFEQRVRGVQKRRTPLSLAPNDDGISGGIPGRVDRRVQLSGRSRRSVSKAKIVHETRIGERWADPRRRRAEDTPYTGLPKGGSPDTWDSFTVSTSVAHEEKMTKEGSFAIFSSDAAAEGVLRYTDDLLQSSERAARISRTLDGGREGRFLAYEAFRRDRGNEPDGIRTALVEAEVLASAYSFAELGEGDLEELRRLLSEIDIQRANAERLPGSGGDGDAGEVDMTEAAKKALDSGEDNVVLTRAQQEAIESGLLITVDEDSDVEFMGPGQYIDIRRSLFQETPDRGMVTIQGKSGWFVRENPTADRAAKMGVTSFALPGNVKKVEMKVSVRMLVQAPDTGADAQYGPVAEYNPLSLARLSAQALAHQHGMDINNLEVTVCRYDTTSAEDAPSCESPPVKMEDMQPWITVVDMQEEMRVFADLPMLLVQIRGRRLTQDTTEEAGDASSEDPETTALQSIGRYSVADAVASLQTYGSAVVSRGWSCADVVKHIEPETGGRKLTCITASCCGPAWLNRGGEVQVVFDAALVTALASVLPSSGQSGVAGADASGARSRERIAGRIEQAVQHATRSLAQVFENDMVGLRSRLAGEADTAPMETKRLWQAREGDSHAQAILTPSSLLTMMEGDAPGRLMISDAKLVEYVLGTDLVVPKPIGARATGCIGKVEVVVSRRTGLQRSRLVVEFQKPRHRIKPSMPGAEERDMSDEERAESVKKALMEKQEHLVGRSAAADAFLFARWIHEEVERKIQIAPPRKNEMYALKLDDPRLEDSTGAMKNGDIVFTVGVIVAQMRCRLTTIPALSLDDEDFGSKVVAWHAALASRLSVAKWNRQERDPSAPVTVVVRPTDVTEQTLEVPPDTPMSRVIASILLRLGISECGFARGEQFKGADVSMIRLKAGALCASIRYQLVRTDPKNLELTDEEKEEKVLAIVKKHGTFGVIANGRRVSTADEVPVSEIAATSELHVTGLWFKPSKVFDGDGTGDCSGIIGSPFPLEYLEMVDNPATFAEKHGRGTCALAGIGAELAFAPWRALLVRSRNVLYLPLGGDSSKTYAVDALTTLPLNAFRCADGPLRSRVRFSGVRASRFAEPSVSVSRTGSCVLGAVIAKAALALGITRSDLRGLRVESESPSRKWESIDSATLLQRVGVLQHIRVRLSDEPLEDQLLPAVVNRDVFEYDFEVLKRMYDYEPVLDDDAEEAKEALLDLASDRDVPLYSVERAGQSWGSVSADHTFVVSHYDSVSTLVQNALKEASGVATRAPTHVCAVIGTHVTEATPGHVMLGLIKSGACFPLVGGSNLVADVLDFGKVSALVAIRRTVCTVDSDVSPGNVRSECEASQSRPGQCAIASVHQSEACVLASDAKLEWSLFVRSGVRVEVLNSPVTGTSDATDLVVEFGVDTVNAGGEIEWTPLATRVSISHGARWPVKRVYDLARSTLTESAARDQVHTFLCVDRDGKVPLVGSETSIAAYAPEEDGVLRVRDCDGAQEGTVDSPCAPELTADATECPAGCTAVSLKFDWRTEVGCSREVAGKDVLTKRLVKGATITTRTMPGELKATKGLELTKRWRGAGRVRLTGTVRGASSEWRVDTRLPQRMAVAEAVQLIVSQAVSAYGIPAEDVAALKAHAVLRSLARTAVPDTLSLADVDASVLEAFVVEPWTSRAVEDVCAKQTRSTADEWACSSSKCDLVIVSFGRDAAGTVESLSAVSKPAYACVPGARRSGDGGADGGEAVASGDDEEAAAALSQIQRVVARGARLVHVYLAREMSETSGVSRRPDLARLASTVGDRVGIREAVSEAMAGAGSRSRRVVDAPRLPSAPKTSARAGLPVQGVPPLAPPTMIELSEGHWLKGLKVVLHVAVPDRDPRDRYSAVFGVEDLVDAPEDTPVSEFVSGLTKESAGSAPWLLTPITEYIVRMIGDAGARIVNNEKVCTLDDDDDESSACLAGIQRDMVDAFRSGHHFHVHISSAVERSGTARAGPQIEVDPKMSAAEIHEKVRLADTDTRCQLEDMDEDTLVRRYAVWHKAWQEDVGGVRRGRRSRGEDFEAYVTRRQPVICKYKWLSASYVFFTLNAIDRHLTFKFVEMTDVSRPGEDHNLHTFPFGRIPPSWRVRFTFERYEHQASFLAVFPESCSALPEKYLILCDHRAILEAILRKMLVGRNADAPLPSALEAPGGRVVGPAVVSHDQIHSCSDGIESSACSLIHWMNDKYPTELARPSDLHFEYMAETLPDGDSDATLRPRYFVQRAVVEGRIGDSCGSEIMRTSVTSLAPSIEPGKVTCTRLWNLIAIEHGVPASELVLAGNVAHHCEDDRFTHEDRTFVFSTALEDRCMKRQHRVLQNQWRWLETSPMAWTKVLELGSGGDPRLAKFETDNVDPTGRCFAMVYYSESVGCGPVDDVFGSGDDVWVWFSNGRRPCLGSVEDVILDASGSGVSGYRVKYKDEDGEEQRTTLPRRYFGENWPRVTRRFTDKDTVAHASFVDGALRVRTGRLSVPHCTGDSPRNCLVKFRFSSIPHADLKSDDVSPDSTEESVPIDEVVPVICSPEMRMRDASTGHPLAEELFPDVPVLARMATWKLAAVSKPTAGAESGASADSAASPKASELWMPRDRAASDSPPAPWALGMLKQHGQDWSLDSSTASMFSAGKWSMVRSSGSLPLELNSACLRPVGLLRAGWSLSAKSSLQTGSTSSSFVDVSFSRQLPSGAVSTSSAFVAFARDSAVHPTMVLPPLGLVVEKAQPPGKGDKGPEGKEQGFSITEDVTEALVGDECDKSRLLARISVPHRVESATVRVAGYHFTSECAVRPEAPAVRASLLQLNAQSRKRRKARIRGAARLLAHSGASVRDMRELQQVAEELGSRAEAVAALPVAFVEQTLSGTESRAASFSRVTGLTGYDAAWPGTRTIGSMGSSSFNVYAHAGVSSSAYESGESGDEESVESVFGHQQQLSARVGATLFGHSMDVLGLDAELDVNGGTGFTAGASATVLGMRFSGRYPHGTHRPATVTAGKAFAALSARAREIVKDAGAAVGEKSGAGGGGSALDELEGLSAVESVAMKKLAGWNSELWLRALAENRLQPAVECAGAEQAESASRVKQSGRSALWSLQDEISRVRSAVSSLGSLYEFFSDISAYSPVSVRVGVSGNVFVSLVGHGCVADARVKGRDGESVLAVAQHGVAMKPGFSFSATPSVSLGWSWVAEAGIRGSIDLIRLSTTVGHTTRRLPVLYDFLAGNEPASQFAAGAMLSTKHHPVGGCATSSTALSTLSGYVEAFGTLVGRPASTELFRWSGPAIGISSFCAGSFAQHGMRLGACCSPTQGFLTDPAWVSAKEAAQREMEALLREQKEEEEREKEEMRRKAQDERSRRELKQLLESLKDGSEVVEDFGKWEAKLESEALEQTAPHVTLEKHADTVAKLTARPPPAAAVESLKVYRYIAHVSAKVGSTDTGVSGGDEDGSALEFGQEKPAVLQVDMDAMKGEGALRHAVDVTRQFSVRQEVTLTVKVDALVDIVFPCDTAKSLGYLKTRGTVEAVDDGSRVCRFRTQMSAPQSVDLAPPPRRSSGSGSSSDHDGKGVRLGEPTGFFGWIGSAIVTAVSTVGGWLGVW